MSFAELFLLGIPAVLLTGISKGGFGGALGGIAVPLLALMMPPPGSAAIMLPILCMADITGLRRFYGKWDLHNLKIMLPGALLGVLAGTLSFGLLSERLLGLMIGGIAIVFFLLNVLNAAATQSPSTPKVVKGTLLSGIAGFTSFVAHAGGPPIMMYLLPQQMDKVRYVATVNCFFLLTNAIKLVPYALLGQFTTTSLTASLALAPIVVAGVWLGIWLQGRVNHTWFYRIAWAGLLVTGIQLLVQNW
ncbi:sulfite exporter TauE/SafE family protein [Pseudomonas sp. JG-B]|uniref:sulfite exporter TauE/SafE family protein n=1 Tax=Pseudomonas sp. JG-B TaxID=2603214 RepID=UPI00129E2114|nr:sulfite exporter TauE/SafE family protein [Pseudomonas sp. JG-B]MRK23825.1 sulfite exporter TauE/SafE family protein [Pseudomonas sp. JG-B]